MLSQIANQMFQSALSGRSAPDAPPIPVVIHELLREVLEPLAAMHPESEIAGLSSMLEEAIEISATRYCS